MEDAGGGSAINVGLMDWDGTDRTPERTLWRKNRVLPGLVSLKKVERRLWKIQSTPLRLINWLKTLEDR